MPNYCSECGHRFPGGIHHSNPEAILYRDDEAQIKYTEKK